MIITKPYITVTVVAILALLVGVAVQTPPVVQAADNDFSDSITVDSTLDTPDNNIGDNICDDGDGNCTLRAAIEESNDTAGTQTIGFNITGTADFTNDGQDGYTFRPGSPLPHLDDTVIIDGYSQPGSLANTAEAPNPLNSRLLIEIDGSNIGGVWNGLTFDGASSGSAGSIVRGLVINSVDQHNGIQICAQDIDIVGNYIGTEPDGMTAAANGFAGITNCNTYSTDDINAQIGGLNSEDRNIISGNNSSGIYPVTGWVIQGNYVGVGRDGLTAVPNTQTDTAGSLSIDDCSDVLVGGPQETAINVISGNDGKGLAPNNTTNVTIENNYIGVGYDRTTSIPNGIDGIAISGVNSDFIVKNNTISHNVISGIYLDQAQGGLIVGNQIMHNGVSGIQMVRVSDIIVGGNDASERNVISNNNLSAVNNYGNMTLVNNVSSSSNVKIQGNYIGVDEDGRVNPAFVNHGANIHVKYSYNGVLIGGVNPGEGNIIAGSTGPAIAVSEAYVPSIPLAVAPQNISVLGNSIYDSDGGAGGTLQNSFSETSGLGIDLFQLTLNGSFAPQSLNNVGLTPNDLSDSDTGPNGYINFPVLNTATQTGNSLTLNYDLDAADSPSDEYRVEFFANDAADASGHGEGQSFLGAVTASNGNGNTATLTLPNGTDLTGKVLSATTTAVNDTTDSGFGSTSEFSAVLAAEVVAAATSNPDGAAGAGGDLAKTGQNVFSVVLAGTVIVSAALASVVARRKYVYRLGSK